MEGFCLRTSGSQDDSPLGSNGSAHRGLTENSVEREIPVEQQEARQARLELLYDEVLSLDPGAMTEEDARQAGIRFLTAYVETTGSYARSSLGCNLLFVLISVLLFQDAAITSDAEYDSYRSAKKLLRKFQKDTYKKGYVAYLIDCQSRINEQRQRQTMLEQQAEERRQRKEARRAARRR